MDDDQELSSLTSLPTGNAIGRALFRVSREDRPYAVMYCDLSDFKSYNDHAGLLRGDMAIQATARALDKALSPYDRTRTFLGHIGGDDFVVIVPLEWSEAVAEGIRRAFQEERRSFYDPADLERGHMEVEGTRGQPRRVPLIEMAIRVKHVSASAQG